jgi:hypothetical protein
MWSATEAATVYAFPEVSEEELEALQTRLQALLGHAVRELRLSWEGNGVVLQGRAKRFYAKQLAQTMLQRLCEHPILANRIEVD